MSGLYYLKLDIDRAKIARYGINVAEITEVIEAVGGGIAAGEVFEGQWRFPIIVRFPDDRRTDVETIAALWVTAPDGSRIPLRELADIRIVEGPAQISREHASRRIVIEANVVGRDLVGAVEEAQTGVARLVQLPPGYYLTWGGQFENQQKAMARLAVVVPLVIGLIFLLLYFTFGNLRHAALILLAIPFAMVGRSRGAAGWWAVFVGPGFRRVHRLVRCGGAQWGGEDCLYHPAAGAGDAVGRGGVDRHGLAVASCVDDRSRAQ